LKLAPVFHKWSFIDFPKQLKELVIKVIFESVAVVGDAVKIIGFGWVEHQQLFGIIIVQFLYFLRKSDLVDYLIVNHLLIPNEKGQDSFLNPQIIRG